MKLMGSLLEISAVAAGICSWVAWIAIGLVAGFLADRVFWWPSTSST